MATIAEEARPRDLKDRRSLTFGVVGIGASAGGLDAIGRLLDDMPVDTGMAFVLIQHMDPLRESMMAGLLAVRTRMPVAQADAGMNVEPDHVYICPPGFFLSLSGGSFRLTPPEISRGVRLPIDFFFQSLAAGYGGDAIAVILSGHGEDGSAGLKAVAAGGGLIIVQEPKEAASRAMPNGAIATGLADHVLPVAKIAKLIGNRRTHGENLVGDEVVTGNVKAIIDLLGSDTAHGFSDYKAGTLRRRIERRMTTSGTSDAVAYLARLHEDRDELEALASDMFINVTGFFRDPDAFRRISDEILPDLMSDKSMPKALRIWSAGCSTGEEAYSLAILCLEAMARSGNHCKLQVFASDIDAAAVRTAREGLYPASIAAEVSTERLHRFFVAEDGGFRVSHELRGVVVFTVHDLLADPPFLQMDLIACRNLMIYLRGDAQRAVLLQLDFALNDGGILLLGSSETVGLLVDRFKTIDAKHRLYRHTGAIRAAALALSGLAAKRGGISQRAAHGRPLMPGLGDTAQTFILETLAPAAVVINDKRQVLYASGPTDRFLRLPAGDADADVLAMARHGLRSVMRTAITMAIAKRRFVSNTVSFTIQGRVTTLNVSVRPMAYDGADLYLLGFTEESGRTDAPFGANAPAPSSSAETQLLEAGQREAEANRRDLDAALRDIDVLEGERESATKEAMSVAEEYQATNEELVTSREELQSLNEELTVLNSQLQGSLELQRGLANDLQNILHSADLATLFLDEQLRIRFFTPESRSIVCVKDGDVGRPLADLTLLVNDPELLRDAAAVLATGNTIELEIEDRLGRCYMRRVLPYASNGTADRGVVLTFSDITGLTAATRAAQEARAYADAVIDTTPLPMVVLDKVMRAVSANRAFYRTYAPGADAGHDHFEPPHERLSQLPILRMLLEKLKTIEVPVENHELVLDGSALGPRTLFLSANRIHDGPMGNEKILVLIDDVTERMRVKAALRTAKADAERANAEKSRFLSAASHDLRQPLQTLSLLHGLLVKTATEPPTRKLVDHLDETLVTMSDILDSLLDINQLEVGTVRARQVDLAIDDVLKHLGNEFSIPAAAGGLTLKVLGSHYRVHSDPRLLGQMLRNLLSNALKYTQRGGVLVGCRHAGQYVRIEVWDTGPGIPESDFGIIFEEFQQLGNPARERTKGQGLGLAIVQRLGVLLDHPVNVRSRTGKGSVFSVTVPLSEKEERGEERGQIGRIIRSSALQTTDHATTVLIVEDDMPVRNLLRMLLEGDGLKVVAARDGPEAIDFVRTGAIKPAVIITDLNLPNGINGLELISELRVVLQHSIPAIILTGDVAKTTMRAITDRGAVHLAKPVTADALLEVVHSLRAEAVKETLTLTPPRQSHPASGEPPTVFVVDDDPGICLAMQEFLSGQNFRVATFSSGTAFLDHYRPGEPGCLLVDARMPDMNGFDLIKAFRARGHTLRAIMMTGYGDVSTAVAAMKAGAEDFIEKPIGNGELLACIGRAVTVDQFDTKHTIANEAALRIVASLTVRQRAVLNLVLAGHPSKVIAFDLGISQRTVENHRAAIMRKTATRSIPMLIRAVSSVL